MTVLVATDAEYAAAKKYLQGLMVIKTGIGAGNVIRTCCNIPDRESVVNIGYCGSNVVPVGTVSLVSRTYRLTDGAVEFEDWRNGHILAPDGIGLPCYTSNSFVTSTDIESPVLFDMELNYIAAFPFHLAGAIKIVSDNLSVEWYERIIGNTEREAEAWGKAVDMLLGYIIGSR